MWWMLDAFDVMLYALILTAGIDDFGLSTLTSMGDMLTTTGASDGDNNGTHRIVTVVGAAQAETDGSAADETFGSGVTATVSTCLDAELEDFAEYVWLCAAIKSLAKEESSMQAKELKEQRNLIRSDLTEALETDSGGPSTIIDTDGGNGGYW